MNFRCFLFVFLLLSQIVFSQILDDTTKEVYGNHSTRYFLQEDLFTDSELNRVADSSIKNLHYYNYQIMNGNYYQNLGNLGTAMKPVFFRPPAEIGYRLGFESFHPYLLKPDRQRYFDTKSPYSELEFFQGSTGEQKLFILFTRNVNRFWNLGASYNRFTSVKQFSPRGNRDFQTDHHQINVFTSVKSRKDKYIGLLSFNYMQHWNFESGGIALIPSTETNNIVDNGLYLYKYADIRLLRGIGMDARNYYRTTNLHLYHQFNPLDSGVSAFQLFHEADWKRENQYFRDRNMMVDSAFRDYYGGVYFGDSILTSYKLHMELFQNKAGIKGSTGPLFYNTYFKSRTYSLADTSQDSNTVKKPKIWFHDVFAGGGLKYQLTSKLSVSVNGEALLNLKTNSHQDDTVYKSHDDYLLNVEVKSAKFSFQAGQSRVSPTLIQTRLVNNLSNWSQHKDFTSHPNYKDAALYRNATMSYTYSKGERYVKAGLHYQRIDNLIYFRQAGKGPDSLKVIPVQDTTYLDYIQPSVSFRYNRRWLFFESDIILTNVFTRNDLVHMPAWFCMPKIYYQNYLFKKAVEVQGGVEVLLKADYYADAYAPQINSFYWQDDFVVKTFPITNIFVNFRIKSAKVFLRVGNLFGDQNQQLGYMETPYYAGMKRSFQFGVQWRAFN